MMKIVMTAILCTLSTWLTAQATFDARKLIVLSDADMAASAYIDGQLRLIQEDQDVLTVMDMEEFPSQVTLSTLPVSNSVTNWTKSLDVSRDGSIAFVAETRGSVERTQQTVGNVFADLPAGRLLTAIAVEEGLRIVDQIDVGNIPLVAQLSPDGKWIAVSIEEPGREIALVPWDGKQFGTPRFFSTGKPIAQKIRATDLTWHPSGKHLAVTLEESKEVAFYAVAWDELRLRMVGEPVQIGLLPGAGQFTPNGQFYLIPDIDDWVSPGYFLSIQPDFEGGDHAIVSRVEVGKAPEGFGISPDGSKVLVANMEGSHFPQGSPLRTRGSSLSLLSLSREGELKEVVRERFPGILPENVAFDADGDMAAIAVFDYHDLGLRKGAVEFWEVHNDQLVYSGTKVSVTRGAHVLNLVY